jgi:hypothetical protein
MELGWAMGFVPQSASPALLKTCDPFIGCFPTDTGSAASLDKAHFGLQN